MINRKDGGLMVAGGNYLGQSLTRTEFVAQYQAFIVREFDARKGWTTYVLDPSVSTDGRFAISTTFADEVLRSISLVLRIADDPKSWAEWQEKRELERLERHNAFLQSELGDPHTKTRGGVKYRFVWGHASSFYDMKSGGSSIVVSYH
jgi:hypothetical protein